MGGSSFVIPKQSKYPYLAWLFYEYLMLTPDGYKAVYGPNKIYPGRLNTSLPSYLPAQKEQLFENPQGLGGQNLWETAVSTVKDIPANYYYAPWYRQAADIIANYVQRMQDGQISPEDALKNSADDITSKCVINKHYISKYNTLRYIAQFIRCISNSCGYVTLVPFHFGLEILMPRPQDIAPTYDQVIENTLREVSAPVSVLELAQKIVAIRPLTAKDPVKAAEMKIKEAIGRQLVYLDSNTIVPLQIAWQGVRFRMDLSREEVNKGFFDIGNALSYYLPNGFNLANLRLVDADGQAIKFKVNAVNKKVKGIFGTFDQTFYYCHISEWLREHKFAPKDHLLFTILDRENGVLEMEHEPYRQINTKLLESRNRQLADILYELLENSSYEQILLTEALPTAYARLPEKDSYPPDHWVILLSNDERMETNGWDIVYRDGKNPCRMLCSRKPAETNAHRKGSPFQKNKRNRSIVSKRN